MEDRHYQILLMHAFYDLSPVRRLLPFVGKFDMHNATKNLFHFTQIYVHALLILAYMYPETPSKKRNVGVNVGVNHENL